MVAQNAVIANAPAPWDLPDSVINSDVMQEAVYHAQAFSLVIQGARFRYVGLLYDAQRNAHLPISDGEEDLNELVAEWQIQMQTHSAQTTEWVPLLTDMYELLRRFRVNIGASTRGFVAQWCAAAVHDPAQAMKSQHTAQLITNREWALKTSNARLVSESALRSWDGSLFGSRPLDYRWAIAQNMLLDCRSGLG